MKKVHNLLKDNINSSIGLLYRPFKRWMPLHTFRYLACGGSNTVFDIVLFTISYHFILRQQNLVLGPVTISSYIASFILAFSISFCTGFYLNRYVVFQESGLNKRQQLSRVLAVNLTSILLNYILLKVLIEWLKFYPTPAKIIATLLIACISYFSQTYFFFRNPRKTD